MTTQEKAQAEILKQQEDVKTALDQTAMTTEGAAPPAERKERFWFVTYALILLGLSLLYYLLELDVLFFVDKYQATLLRLTALAMWGVMVLAIAKAVELYLISRVHSAVSRYNLTQVLRLVVGLAIAAIAVSIFIGAQWYTLLASLGVISLIVGLALQTPLSSFFAWIYLLVRQPYRVGDRIKIGDLTGDVINVSYLDTTLWEFGGQYLSTDHPSGRIIKFPNSTVLSRPVINYSWPLFPYIWNEIKINVAYESDLEFVAKVMQEVAEEEMGEVMMERVRVYRELLAQTPVDQLTVQERPTVIFRTSSNTWLEAIVRYLVYPKEQGRVKTRLIKKMLARLKAEPGRAMFPTGNTR